MRVFFMALQLQSISCLGEHGNMAGASPKHEILCSSRFIFNFSFILPLAILLHLIKSKSEIEGLAIFDHYYHYSAYADDTIFFLQDTISIKHMVIFFLIFLIKTKLKKT